MIKDNLLLLAQIVDPKSVKVPKPEATDVQIETILRIVFTMAGAVAVVVIVIAGISYILSAGDPQRTAKAKDAILYAVIGLIIAIMANVIVVFVIGNIFK